MTGQLRSLETLQRWMQEVITHPLGIEAGIVSDEAREEIETSVDSIQDVVTRSKACTSIERLSVYGDAYYARLIECMRELFPATVYALEEETFDQFVLEYLQACPPHSYTLEHLADGFVDFLEESRPDEEEPGELGAEWSAFLVDLVKLEWTIDRVFDGPGVEGQSQFSAEQLQAIAPEDWPKSRILVAPCLHLLELRFPVNDFYSGFRNESEPDFPEPAESLVAISRRDYVVRRFDLSRPQFDLLAALIDGATIEQAIAACDEAFFAHGGTEQQLAASMPRWFRLWTSEGFFVDVSSTDD